MPTDRERLLDLLARWEDLASRGQDISPDELCKDHPDLLAEVLCGIEKLRSAAWMNDGDGGTDSPSDGSVIDPGPEPDLPRTLAGRYRLDKLIGEGGFGRVYQGYDPELDRPVAVKIPRPDRLASPDQADLFRQEAKRVARLRHPGIVPVFDAGQDGAVFFIVSDLIDGTDLAARIAADRPSHRDAARIVAEVAEHLHHAHEQGFIHRDIKPANILLDRQGRAFLTDFGIAATEADARRGLETTGTLAYMAPEQRTGEPHVVDARTDIYSLGVVLYELLAGRRPYQASTPSAWKEKDLTREPPRPRSIDGSIPRELERICLRCLTRRAEDRYGSARELALNLRMVLNNQRSYKGLRRSLVVVLITVAVATCISFWKRKTSPGPAPKDSPKDAVVVPDGSTARPEPPPKVTSVLLRFQDAPVGEVLRLKGHTAGVMSVAFSPDGRYAISGSRDKTIRIWDLGTGEEVRRCVGHRLEVWNIAMSKDGRRIASCGTDTTVRLWDFATAEPIRTLLGHTEWVYAVTFSPDGKLILSGGGSAGKDIAARLRDAESGQEIRQLNGNGELISSVAYSRDGTRALTGSEDKTAALWDTGTWTVKLRLAGHDSFIKTVSFSPDGASALTGSGMTWSHEERRLVAGTDDTIRLWDLGTGEEVRRFVGHANWVNSTAFSPDGKRILSGSGGHIEEDGRWTGGSDCTVRLWDARSGEEIRRFDGHHAPVRGVVFSPDGGFALSGGDDGIVRLWRLP